LTSGGFYEIIPPTREYSPLLPNYAILGQGGDANGLL
jgi:hypothetical protein